MDKKGFVWYDIGRKEMQSEVPYLKKQKSKSRRFRAGTVLLALVGVAGAELAVCYWIDRPIYYRITTPITSAISTTLQVSGEKMRILADWTAQTAQTMAEQIQATIEAQRAGPPRIVDDGTSAPPRVTRLVQREQAEILTGGSIEIRYFAQSDAQWKDLPYGVDNIGEYGCGPTALCMAVDSLTGRDLTPAQMANWCAMQGYAAPGSGSYLSVVQGVADAYGLVCTPAAELTPDELFTELSGGKIAVALMKAGHFTDSGHFILLHGTTLDGEILVADPNSRERSLQLWEAQLICDELSDLRVNGAPIWFLSTE